MHSHPPTPASFHSHQRGRFAFTLIELLVVITIIAVLISILIPTMGYVKNQSKKAATTALLNSIGTGLENYYRDFNFYPPSNPLNAYQSASPVTPPFDNGGLMLAQGLTGYLDYQYDGAGPSTPAATKDPLYGFRTRTGGLGQIYGPYAQPTGSSWKVADATHQYFVDLWGNEILYYRAIPMNRNGANRTVTKVFDVSTNPSFQGVFVTDENLKYYDANYGVSHTEATVPDPTASDPSGKFPFLSLLGASNGNAYAGGSLLGSQSYLLVSAGPDGKFFTADDIVAAGK